jgi:hypothetical protein
MKIQNRSNNWSTWYQLPTKTIKRWLGNWVKWMGLGGTHADTNNTIQISWNWYTQWLYKRMVVSSIMIRNMIKQTNHKPQWHLLIDSNLNSMTLGSYWPWRCGIFKFTIRIVWLCCHGAIVLTLRVSKAHWIGDSPSTHTISIPELYNDSSFNFGVLLEVEMWDFQVQIRLFGCVVMAPLSRPWESPKPIELVTRPPNIKF